MAALDSPGEGPAADLLLTLTPGIGPRLRKALLEHFGSAAAAARASARELCDVPGIGRKLSESIIQARREVDVRAELERCRASGVRVLSESEDGYPDLLRKIADPPGVLFLRGELAASDGLAVA